MPIKLLFVMGTRPEVIKLAPVIKKAKSYPAQLKVIVCVTGQHKEMLTQALEAFTIVPDISLEVMSKNQTLSELTSILTTKLTHTLQEVQPDWLVVQGDTTSAFIASLCAFYQNIKIAHVEAGLRTHNLQSPFPEELNRQIISKIANWHFAPTILAAENIKQEKNKNVKLLVTGNTIVDSINIIVKEWTDAPVILPKVLQKLTATNKKIILITCHRRENFGETLLAICRAILQLAAEYKNYYFIFPVHFNPNVRKHIHEELQNIKNIILLPPLDYKSMLYLLSHAALVLTDSGGIQEEAPSFAVPTVVMREYTERQEGITAGFAILAGVSEVKITHAAKEFLASPNVTKLLQKRKNPYGDGLASERIIKALLGETVEPFHG